MTMCRSASREPIATESTRRHCVWSGRKRQTRLRRPGLTRNHKRRASTGRTKQAPSLPAEGGKAPRSSSGVALCGGNGSLSLCSDNLRMISNAWLILLGRLSSAFRSVWLGHQHRRDISRRSACAVPVLKAAPPGRPLIVQQGSNGRGSMGLRMPEPTEYDGTSPGMARASALGRVGWRWRARGVVLP